MKKILIIGGVLLLALALVITVMTLSDPEQEPLRVYMWRESAEEVFKPSFVLFDDGTFSMTFSGLSSYIGRGTYAEEDGQLVLRTDDGDFTYYFDIVDDTYVFDAEKSSDYTWYADIPDGAVFH
ncbi:MAG: hypothetical protein IKM70_03345 [Firmicutes bacterium]|nr:hypothetical protein [Bacillota bacterium]